MRNVNGWWMGALGTAAVLGAFVLGARVAATPAALAPVPAVAETAAAPTGATAGLEFACAPGQRVVMREATATTPTSAQCVGDAAAAVTVAPRGDAVAVPVVAVAERPAPRPYAQPAVFSEPLEEYRPRPVPVSYPSERDVRAPVRTKTKSAVIIGSSTAVGATIGGLTKGKKGAIVGGILGGGAATVWDQVTRRQGNDRR